MEYVSSRLEVSNVSPISYIFGHDTSVDWPLAVSLVHCHSKEISIKPVLHSQ